MNAPDLTIYHRMPQTNDLNQNIILICIFVLCEEGSIKVRHLDFEDGVCTATNPNTNSMPVMQDR